MKSQTETDIEMTERELTVYGQNKEDHDQEGNIPPDWMIISAVRYAIGRMSYVVSETCDWLEKNWESIPDRVKYVIAADLHTHFQADDIARDLEERASLRPLGTESDRGRWERVRQLLQQ